MQFYLSKVPAVIVFQEDKCSLGWLGERKTVAGSGSFDSVIEVKLRSGAKQPTLNEKRDVTISCWAKLRLFYDFAVQ